MIQNGFAEMNRVRIIRGISKIQACNPILVIPPNAIIIPKKKNDFGSLKMGLLSICMQDSQEAPTVP